MLLFNSFKTFLKISEETLPLEKRLPNYQYYFAHIHSKKESELLSHHTELVAHYSLKLIDVHHLESVIDRLIYPIVNQPQINELREAGDFVKTLFWRAIIFHDYGKVNENFQVIRMNNPHFTPNSDIVIDSKHSILSAILFIVEHFQELLQSRRFTRETQTLLGILSFLFASTILKHHASYFQNEINFNPELINALNPYLNLFRLKINDKMITVIQKLQNKSYFQELIDCYVPVPGQFPLFALLKLNFSLLTASDYYATSAYRSNLIVDDFGVLNINDKEQLMNKFRKTKYYNRQFFARETNFLNFPDDVLQEYRAENLNILRQKLLAEAIDAIRNNQKQKVFYLEAPTGAGKTNISLAVALELMKNTPEINKVFYVFPFTTLITQTYKTIQETLEISNDEMIQLHSRTGFHCKSEEQKDGNYGAEHLNYIDNLFVNYPITLMSHIKFFDILKGNQKETNYILHRLANSVVIIDELQSYQPKNWDKISYFITNYAHYFNIKFILMSATLPKLDSIKIQSMDTLDLPQKFIPLLKDKSKYFQNPNFKYRVKFDFTLLEKKITIEELANFVYKKCEEYSNKNNGKVKAIIEFIFKRTAGKFYNHISTQMQSDGYKIFLLSGTILEPRRKEIIQSIKSIKENNSTSKKILLVTTQVVEAGMDIDMNIGFKDRSLIDSDEQLAGRVNRNAIAINAMVYLFQLDRAYSIYGQDLRYSITRDVIDNEQYQAILENKTFDTLYQHVCHHINRNNTSEYVMNIDDYLNYIKYLKLSEVDRNFKLIDEKTLTIYVPLKVPVEYLSKSDIKFLTQCGCYNGEETVDGKKVWDLYLKIVASDYDDFISKRIDLKKIYGIMSQFMFSIHAQSSQIDELKRYAKYEYDMFYLHDWEEIYDYCSGMKDEKFSDPMVFL